MSKKLAGVAVTTCEVHIALLTSQNNGQFILDDHITMNLQTGERPPAYSILFNQFVDYTTQRAVGCVCIKSSALSRAGIKKAHLEAAELRGVVQAAAASVCEVRLTNKAAASRTFGDRKVDEYLKDDLFWTALGLDNLPKGKREAAFAVMNHFAERP